MGASGWWYTTPYDSDIEAALLRLQEEVFERGNNDNPWKDVRRYSDSLLAKTLDQLEHHERHYLTAPKNFAIREGSLRLKRRPDVSDGS